MQSKDNKTEWLTIQEAIRLTGISDSTIRRYIKDNKIRYQYSQARRRYRIDTLSLLQYLEYGDENNA